MRFTLAAPMPRPGLGLFWISRSTSNIWDRGSRRRPGPPLETMDGEGVAGLMKSRPLASPSKRDARTLEESSEDPVDRLRLIEAAPRRWEERCLGLSRPQLCGVGLESLTQL